MIEKTPTALRVNRSERLFRVETERNRIGREVIEARIARLQSLIETPIKAAATEQNVLGSLLDKLADAEANIELLKRRDRVAPPSGGSQQEDVLQDLLGDYFADKKVDPRSLGFDAGCLKGMAAAKKIQLTDREAEDLVQTYNTKHGQLEFWR